MKHRCQNLLDNPFQGEKVEKKTGGGRESVIPSAKEDEKCLTSGHNDIGKLLIRKENRALKHCLAITAPLSINVYKFYYLNLFTISLSLGFFTVHLRNVVFICSCVITATYYVTGCPAILLQSRASSSVNKRILKYRRKKA